MEAKKPEINKEYTIQGNGMFSSTYDGKTYFAEFNRENGYQAIINNEKFKDFLISRGCKVVK